MTETIANIISRAQKRGNIPDGSPTYQATTFLAFAQEALSETVFPWLYGINEDFSLIKKTIPLTSSGVTLYPLGDVPLPARCYGRSLTELKYLDPSQNLYNMPLVNLADEDIVQRNANYPSMFQGAPSFFLRGDVIHLCARIENLTGSLIATFPVKIPTLVSSSTLHADITNIVYGDNTTIITAGNFVTGCAYRIISAGTTDFTLIGAADSNVGTVFIATGAGAGSGTAVRITTFTVSTPGTDFNTYCANTNPDTTKRFDIFRRTSGQYTNIDLIMTRTGATTLINTELTEDEVDTLKAYQQGGFSNISYYTSDLIILPAEQNNYSPVPQELDNYFVLSLVDRYLESIGDVEGLQVNQVKMQKEEKNAAKALAKRVIHEAKTINNRRGIRAYLNPMFFRRT